MESLRSAWKLRISSRLKLLIGFVQVAAPLGEVYSITMPEIFRSFLRGMQSLYIDVFGNLFVPTACLGGLFNLLLLKAVVPIGVLLLLWVGLFAPGCVTRRGTPYGALLAEACVNCCQPSSGC